MAGDRDCLGNPWPRPPQAADLHRALPVAYSSDWHQIIAKALYARLMAVRSDANQWGPNNRGDDPVITFTRDELEAAAGAEFGYDLTDSGGLIFCPWPNELGVAKRSGT